jgi:hypothetical protein
MPFLEIVAKCAAILVGIGIVQIALLSAIRSLVLPRSAWDRITSVVFRRVNITLRLYMKIRRINDYRDRDRVMAYFAPVSVLMLLPAWLTMIVVGYMFIYWGLGEGDVARVFLLSGSSLFTLGFASSNVPIVDIVIFSQAMIGMILVALLIAYLPTIYTAFSKRETLVAMMEVRAGSPPWCITMLDRYARIHGLDHLTDMWRQWEVWFAEVEETHTSLVPLVFFRSPQPDHSWVTAAGAVLDTASLYEAVIDRPFNPEAAICIRAGYIAMRRICDFFGITYNPDPASTDPISISRDEFDMALEELEAAGVPLKPDRDQAWRDFAGWRVNYDTVLLALCALTLAPYAPWSSDRSILTQRRMRGGRVAENLRGVASNTP